MRKASVSRASALASAVALGASLCFGNQSSAQVTYLGAGGQGVNPAGSPPNPNRPNGSGGQFGNNGDIISSVVITTGYENIQSQSTTVPANAATAPAIFFQINVYSPSGNPTDITQSNQSGYYTLYELGLETVPGAGLVTTPTGVLNPYNAPIGISTGMNYFIPGFNTQNGSPSTTGDNQLYNYSSGAWNQIAGAGQTNYMATSTVLTPTSITYGIPLSYLGLSVGNSFTFDAYTTFGNPGGQSAYDALDNPNFAPAGYYPYSNGAGTPTPYDSATAGGSLASYTVQTPTLTWNNAGAATGFGDGMTWDNADTSQFNWNNGMFADYYVNGANVLFNDNIGGTSVRNVTLNTTVTPASVIVNNSGGNYTISGSGSIAGAGSLTKSGSSNLTLDTINTYTGGTNVSGGTLVVGVAGALPSGAVNITGGTLQLATSTGGATITSLAISGNGTLDINNNHLVVHYGTGPDPASSIAALLATGYNHGAWNGLGGITSTAAAANSGSYGIGWADAADAGNPAGLSSGTILIKYTLLGDADLNGIVNGIDFGIVAANFNKGVTSWDQGDFDYSHIVNGIDFGDLAANFNKGASGAAAWDELVAFAQANGLMADVPEPATLGLLALSTTCLLARRRRSDEMR